MKTITIELNNDLERALDDLSKKERQDISTVAVKVLLEGLSERNRREKVVKALDDIFSRPIPPSPFDEMNEEEVMDIVNEEIQTVRQKLPSPLIV